MNETKSTIEELQLVAFMLGEEEYTVPIMSVQEIIMPQKTTHLPKIPDFIEGVINLRGHIIPIIDGRKKLGINSENDPADKRTIILELETHTIGLIVDSVSEVLHLNTENIDSTHIDMGNETEVITGIGKYKDRLLILLDPEKLLSSMEVENIHKTLQAVKKSSILNEEKPASKSKKSAV